MIVIRSKRLRDGLRIALPFIVMPALVALGALVFDEKRHLLVSLGMACMALLFFLTGFERRKTGGRRMVIVSVMTALCIVGRFIPLFKPIAALTIITGMYLGGEAGFLVGALSAALSNFYFGQGPWTAFQMLAWGFIGLASGWMANPLKKHRPLLLIFGVIMGAAYSLIMDVWNVLWYGGGFDWALYAAAVTTALPHTILYAVSNFVFLYFLARPFGEKMERVKVKYGV
ncbi:MAG: ECF transporter S component [Clostridia bacterium]|nr:ECF transporter S component [Clostridia bacterium]